MRAGCEAHVHTVLGIPLHLELSLSDVACHSLPVDTHTAGGLPQTQTINAMGMQNLFFMSMSIIFAFHTFYSAHSGCYNNA